MAAVAEAAFDDAGGCCRLRECLQTASVWQPVQLGFDGSSNSERSCSSFGLSVLLDVVVAAAAGG